MSLVKQKDQLESSKVEVELTTEYVNIESDFENLTPPTEIMNAGAVSVHLNDSLAKEESLTNECKNTLKEILEVKLITF